MRRKTERRWTVMLVPHGSGASRAVELSQTVVKALVGIGSVIALLFLVLGGAAQHEEQERDYAPDPHQGLHHRLRQLHGTGGSRAVRHQHDGPASLRFPAHAANSLPRVNCT